MIDIGTLLGSGLFSLSEDERIGFERFLGLLLGHEDSVRQVLAVPSSSQNVCVLRVGTAGAALTFDLTCMATAWHQIWCDPETFGSTEAERYGAVLVAGAADGYTAETVRLWIIELSGSVPDPSPRRNSD
jgi:hypothetical protein